MTELATGQIPMAEMLRTDRLPRMTVINGTSIDVGMDQDLMLDPEVLGLDDGVRVHQIIGFPDAEVVMTDEPINMHERSRKLLALVSYMEDDELTFAVTGHELQNADDQTDMYRKQGSIVMQPGERLIVGRTGNLMQPNEHSRKMRPTASGDNFEFVPKDEESDDPRQLGSVATSRLFGRFGDDGSLVDEGTKFTKLVSREHITIERTEAGFTVTDHSLYGTSVADVPKDQR